jgi:hypothetical protein
MRQGKVEVFRRELAATRSEVDEKRLAAEGAQRFDAHAVKINCTIHRGLAGMTRDNELRTRIHMFACMPANDVRDTGMMYPLVQLFVMRA